MGLCPVDGKPCIDDLCYGGGCIRSKYHEAILIQCDGCGEWVSADGDDECQCDVIDSQFGDENDDEDELPA